MKSTFIIFGECVLDLYSDPIMMTPKETIQTRKLIIAIKVTLKKIKQADNKHLTTFNAYLTICRHNYDILIIMQKVKASSTRHVMVICIQ